MAKVFGKRSRYLYGTAIIHTIAAALYALIGLFTIWRISVKDQAQLQSPIGILAILTVFGPLLAFTYWQYRKHDRGSTTFLSGLRGEESIVAELKSVLGNDYSIFCDVIIDPKFGNIDYVVVGPTGIFTLEVKSHRGKIDFDGKRLIRNSRPLERDFLSQAMGQALSLHNYFQSKLGADIFIRPALVFSNYTDLHFGLKPLRNVSVIRKAWLKQLFESYPTYTYPVDRLIVERELTNLVAPA